ncbi:hypothetical protein KIN20_031263 [Parelaphostrongylus tenuis]|uniref:SET domain-containing protein n=1 Tax=Parelaphostrongylus tenuis TaxID=148309 RepID=A0AAD5R545_PARTN|nr:hypothetical protein KIN20_031263 [Parelaphostrongylus tenuis]
MVQNFKDYKHRIGRTGTMGGGGGAIIMLSMNADRDLIIPLAGPLTEWTAMMKTCNLESVKKQPLHTLQDSEFEQFDQWIRAIYIDPKRKGNVSRFITHGCLPNLTMMRYAENDLRPSRSRAILFAAQPIVGGSEVINTHDFLPKVDEIPESLEITIP